MAGQSSAAQLIAARRSILFFCGIAGPMLLGFAVGLPAAGVSAGLGGLLFCWTDSPGSLAHRMRSLVILAGSAVAGAALGVILAGSGLPLLWPVIVVGGCWAGYAATRGGLWPRAGRDGAVGFAIGTAMQPPSGDELGFLLVGLGLIVLSRIIDHLVNGPLPALSGARGLNKPPTHAGRVRFAVCYAAAASVAVLVGRWLTPQYATWVVVTTLIVMQPDASASFDRIARRIEGALLGVAGAWLTLTLVPQPLPILAVIPLLTLAMPYQVHKRYWLHTALIAWTVLIAHAHGSTSTEGVDTMIADRLIDMVIGAVIAAAGTLVAFPQTLARQRAQ